MTDTNLHNSPTTGDDLSPEDFSDLDGAATANSDAGSEPQGDTPSTPESQGSDTPTTSKADEAFDQFVAEADNPTSATETPAAEPKADKPEAKAPAEDDKKADTTTKPEQGKADAEAEIEVTEQERKDGRVSVKKLTRALDSRRKQKETFTAEIAKRDQALDNLLDLMDSTGLPPKEVRAVTQAIGAARKGDAKAMDQVLQAIGYTPPAPTGPQYSDEDLLAAMERAIQHGDPEIGLDRLKARGGKQAPATPVQTKPDPASSPAGKDAPQARQDPRGERQAAPASDFNESHLTAQLDAMSTSLVQAYGREGAGKLVEKIEARVDAEIKRLQSLGSQLNHKVVASLYREAQGKALAALSEKRPQAPRLVRPAPQSARSDARTADERFEAWLNSGT